VFLVLFLLVPVVALAGLLALDGRRHRPAPSPAPAGLATAFDRPELHDESRARVT
jgi:Na+-transporting methylmalonyl-CoA/oxaloacetate decarboxylase gamma subunit